MKFLTVGRQSSAINHLGYRDEASFMRGTWCVLRQATLDDVQLCLTHYATRNTNAV
jgi:hypothetical protein